jgi:H2-forming N5,N10-methylenetetrahydromethanopterin dehydrogenase-like enzyme
MEENMKARKPLLAALLICALALVACTIPAWVNTVEADAEIAVPIAASLIDVIDPALAPLVSLIESGFSALVKTLDTYKASPTASNLQAVQSAFDAVNSNVAQLESSAQIKNAATRTTVTQVAQLLTQAVTEIAALVPANTGLGKTSSAPHQAKGWKAKDFKTQFNSIVKGDPRFKPLK